MLLKRRQLLVPFRVKAFSHYRREVNLTGQEVYLAWRKPYRESWKGRESWNDLCSIKVDVLYYVSIFPRSKTHATSEVVIQSERRIQLDGLSKPLGIIGEDYRDG